MTWRFKLLNRPELPDSFRGTPTLQVAKQIVRIIESGHFDEQELEEALIMVPGLISGERSKVIGRQLTVPDSGKLDLLITSPHSLGIQVVELKAREIRRGDLIQVLDYARTLEEMWSDDLAWHITIHSGRNGVPRIWNPIDLRKGIESEEKGRGDPDALGIECMVIGTGYRVNIARLARHFGVELKTITELCENWHEYRKAVPRWQSEEDEYDDE